ncbi:GNAT family N-acetyltransferase [Saccharopolyspora sp. HNM0983]|uniref:GNAT family N-acetyltransferase n=1 Tax=Saccharopolyspora montiporae TaxID=2781240 RepID=A0A929BBZ1_9PSEU|nr:GNAT family N-acetyltransferase [Saccharopolyspora sp. HNM0983]
MTTAQDLLAAQSARLAALDPELPPEFPLPTGEPLMARLDTGEPVAGLVLCSDNPPGSVRRLWQAATAVELFPLVGEQPRRGMDAVLAACRQWISARGIPEADSSCAVVWPSRDVQATRALLEHGFVPLSCLAVRAPSPPEDTELSGTVNVRRAGPADVDAVVDLGLVELDYAALVGGSTNRPDAARLKRAAATVRLHAGDPVWLAERGGEAIGVAECGWVDGPLSTGGNRLRPGTWGYVNCVSVRENARGAGVGQRLMAEAHAEFARAGVTGCFLYYNPPNPLSSVFWPRQGYRPLWTTWEVRPATALR